MARFLLDLEYDGQGWHGTAPQPGVPTLEGVLQEILTRLDGCRPSHLRACSRLDAGVAAASYGVSVDLVRSWSVRALGRAINGNLRAHACVRRVATVPADWSALEGCRAKTYIYRVSDRGHPHILDPRIWRLHALPWPRHLHDCAALLPGLQDLSGFACLRHDPSDEADPRREVLAARWDHEEDNGGNKWTFTIRARGFLYKQVRGLVGAMVEAARHPDGVRRFETVRAAGRKAPRLGQIAPAQALVLAGLEWNIPLEWTWI